MAGSAGAQPQPTLGQAQAKLKQLTYKENWLIQRYDQATQDLASARQRLALVNREVSRDMVAVKGMQDQIAQIASNVYENGSMTSPAALLRMPGPKREIGEAEGRALRVLADARLVAPLRLQERLPRAS